MEILLFISYNFSSQNINFYKVIIVYGVNKIIVSTSDEAGEGESKIYEYIRSGKEVAPDSTCLVYGLDADLIMLSINNLPVCPNIYLFR